MAQMGCHVPCDVACLSPFDKIFTRIGSNDMIEQNQSSLSMELGQMDIILQNIIPKKHIPGETTDFTKCLILIDYFGKSTSFEESHAFSIACLEEIIKYSTASVLFVTQDEQILNLTYMYDVVECIQMIGKTKALDEKLIVLEEKLNDQQKEYKGRKIENLNSLKQNQKEDCFMIKDEFFLSLNDNKKKLENFKSLLINKENKKQDSHETMKDFLFNFCKIKGNQEISEEDHFRAIRQLYEMYFSS